MNAESWVTAEQVAQYLVVVKDTVYRWRERKGLPAHKIGRLWQFQLPEVDEWARAVRMKSNKTEINGIAL